MTDAGHTCNYAVPRPRVSGVVLARSAIAGAALAPFSRPRIEAQSDAPANAQRGQRTSNYPVANCLLIELERLGDLGDRQELHREDYIPDGYSYCYAVLNIAGTHKESLERDLAAVRGQLGFRLDPPAGTATS